MKLYRKFVSAVCLAASVLSVNAQNSAVQEAIDKFAQAPSRKYNYSITQIYEEWSTLAYPDIKKQTVKNCMNSLKKIDFKDFAFDIHLERIALESGEFRTLGQTYKQILIFE